MRYDHITVMPLSPHIGAEIGGVDVTKPLPYPVVTEIHDAFVSHQVIFFRDQKITENDQVRLASYFGMPEQAMSGPNIPSKPSENVFVRRFHFDEHSERIAGDTWHADQTCARVPPLGSILYNHTVPPANGGGTLFASMYAAYDALSPRLKTYLEGLTATHDGRRIFGESAPVSIHPIVVRHPVSKRRLIYVNRSFTVKINELPRKESASMLALLFDHIAQPEWTCRFDWRAHSIAFWDNRCTQHYAIADYWPHVRSGFRVQIKGDMPPSAE